MNTQIGPCEIEWLLTSGVCEETLGRESICFTPEIKYRFPLESGDVCISKLEVSKGVDICTTVYRLDRAPFGELVSICDARATCSENTFSTQIWLSGMGCIHEYWHGRQSAPTQIFAGPGQSTFRFPSQSDFTVRIAGGGISETRSAYVPESTLLAFLGDADLNYFLEKLGLSHEIKTVMLPMPPYLSSPLRDAISEQYAGPARHLFAQSKLLEYLGGLVNYLHFGNKKYDRRHATRIRELCDHLLSLEGKLPTLEELAKTFGLSAKQLNSEFAAEFGESIFSFVTTRRLKQAHKVLLESSVPIKVIADRLGYSHVNHFNAAFKNKFGYPPGALRCGSHAKKSSFSDGVQVKCA